MAPSDPPSPAAPSPVSPGSAEDLFGMLYRELHTLAQRHLRHQPAHFTLGTTTLLHEAYLNLAGRAGVHFPDRARFMGYASRAMRGLIIDYARRRSAEKRGGEFKLLPLEPEIAQNVGVEVRDLEELSEALDRLAEVDPALAELVDLHFFCGLEFVEIAGLRGVSDRTVQRDWRKAKMLLHQVLRPSPKEGGTA